MTYRLEAVDVVLKDRGNATKRRIESVAEAANRSTRLRWMVENSFHVCGKIVEKMLHSFSSFIQLLGTMVSNAQVFDPVTDDMP